MDKISFYNISVPFEGYSLLYNTRSHRDRYVGSLVYRESVVPVPMILLDEKMLYPSIFGHYCYICCAMS